MNVLSLSRRAALVLGLSLAALASACGGGADHTATPQGGGANSTATAPHPVATSTPPSLTILGRDGYSEFPDELQTRLGDLTLDRQFGRIGDIATASVEILAGPGWLCGGQNQVPGGVSRLSITAPSGTEIVSFSPETLDRESAAVTSDGRSVAWDAGPATPKPDNCTSSDRSGGGSPTGFFDVLTVFSVTFEVTNVSRISFTADGVPVPRPWGNVSTGIRNEQGTGTGRVPFLTLAEGERARTLAVNGIPSPFELSALNGDGAIDIAGRDWDGSGGLIRISLGGRVLDELPPAVDFDETFQPGASDDLCDKPLEVRQGNIARTVNLTIDCPSTTQP